MENTEDGEIGILVMEWMEGIWGIVGVVAVEEGEAGGVDCLQPYLLVAVVMGVVSIWKFGLDVVPPMECNKKHTRIPGGAAY